MKYKLSSFSIFQRSGPDNAIRLIQRHDEGRQEPATCSLVTHTLSLNIRFVCQLKDKILWKYWRLLLREVFLRKFSNDSAQFCGLWILVLMASASVGFWYACLLFTFCRTVIVVRVLLLCFRWTLLLLIKFLYPLSSPAD